MAPLTKSKESDETETPYGIRVESIKAYGLTTRYRLGLFPVKPLAVITIGEQSFKAGTFDFKSSQWEYRPICAQISALPAMLTLQLLDPHVLTDPTPLEGPYEKLIESKETRISWEREQRDGTKTNVEVNLNFDSPDVTAPTIPDATQEGGWSADLPLREGLQAVENSPWFDTMDAVANGIRGIAEIHPYLNVVASIIDCVRKEYKKQVERDEKIAVLLTDIVKLYESLKCSIENGGKEYRDSKKALIMDVGFETVHCLYFVRGYSSHCLIARMAKSFLDSFDSQLKRHQKILTQLKEEVANNIASTTESMAHRTNERVERLATKVELNNIPYAPGASLLDPAGCCLAGTRTAILDEIYKWANDYGEGSKQVMFLHGVAGEGKSAIAHSVAQMFNDLGCLGSSFRFDRNHLDRTATLLFPTIARDIADLEPPFREQLFSIVENSTRMQTTENLAEQIEMFLKKPLENLLILRPLVIVLDGIDECDQSETVAGLLITCELPPQCRILVTTRSNSAYLRPSLGNCTSGAGDGDRVLMKAVARPTDEEIHLYIKRRLAHLMDEQHGLTLQQTAKLAQASQGLFQWAAVACGSIIASPIGISAGERCKEIIELGRAHTSYPLDKLYSDLLNPLETTRAGLKRFRYALGLVLVAKTPLNTETLDALYRALAGPECSVDDVLKHLGSLLHGTTDKNEDVRILHSSFRDFLIDDKRAGKMFVIDLSDAHVDMVRASMRIMKAELRLNIARISSSYTAITNEVRTTNDDLRNISKHLAYACACWPAHVEYCISHKRAEDITGMLSSFFNHRFLYWLEVISLRNELSLGVARQHLLSLHETWTDCQKSPTFESVSVTAVRICRHIQEALCFMDLFEPVISTSIPLMYLLAVPLYATESSKQEDFLKGYHEKITSDVRFLKGPQTEDVSVATRVEEGPKDTTNLEDSVLGLSTGNTIAMSLDFRYMAIKQRTKVFIHEMNTDHVISFISLEVGGQSAPTLWDMTFASGKEGERLLTLTDTKDEDSRQCYPPISCWEVGTGQRIYVYELTGEEGTLPENPTTFKFARNGSWIFSHHPTTNALYAWRLGYIGRPSPYKEGSDSYDGGKHSYTAKGQGLPVDDGLVLDQQPVIASSQARAHRPDCLVACSCVTGDVIVWEVADSSGGSVCTKSAMKLKLPEEHRRTYSVVEIDFSADETLAIIAYSHIQTKETKIILWKIDDRQHPHRLTELKLDKSIERLVLAPNQTIVCATSQTISLYTFTVTAQPQFSQILSPCGLVTKNSIRFLACNPDGKKIIVVDHSPNLVTCTRSGGPWQVYTQQLYGGAIDASLPLVRFARGGGAAYPVVEVLEPKDLSPVREYRDVPPSAAPGSADPSGESNVVFLPNFRTNWVHHAEHCMLWRAATMHGPEDVENTTVVPILSKSANTGGWSGLLSGLPGVKVAAISSDGTTFAAIVAAAAGASLTNSSHSYQIHVWKGGSVDHLRELDSDWLRDLVYQPAFNLAFSPSGKRLAVSNGYEARVFNVMGGVAWGQRLQTKGKARMDILCMAIAPSDTRCAVGFIDGIGIWDITGINSRMYPIGDLMRCGGDVRPNGVCSVAYSFDGQLLASRSFDGVVRVWDVSAASEEPYTSVNPTIIFSDDPAHALPSPCSLLEDSDVPTHQPEQEQGQEQEAESDEEEKTVVEGNLTPMVYEHVDASEGKTAILTASAMKAAMEDIPRDDDEEDFDIAEHVPEIYYGPETEALSLDPDTPKIFLNGEIANIKALDREADIDIADPATEPELPQHPLIEEILVKTDGWIVAGVGGGGAATSLGPRRLPKGASPAARAVEEHQGRAPRRHRPQQVRPRRRLGAVLQHQQRYRRRRRRRCRDGGQRRRCRAGRRRGNGYRLAIGKNVAVTVPVPLRDRCRMNRTPRPHLTR